MNRQGWETVGKGNSFPEALFQNPFYQKIGKMRNEHKKRKYKTMEN